MASNTTLFFKDSTLTKLCPQENIMFDVLMPSLIACSLLCSRQSACQWVKYIAGTNACLACNDDSLTTTENNVSAAVFYEKDGLDASACPDEWFSVQFGSYAYGPLKGKRKWYEADGYCDQYYTHLVEFDTREEQMDVTRKLRNCKESFWTNAKYQKTSDSSTTNAWQWLSTGHVIHYNDSLWAPGAVEEAMMAAQRFDVAEKAEIMYNPGGCMKPAYGYKLSACSTNETMGALCKKMMKDKN